MSVFNRMFSGSSLRRLTLMAIFCVLAAAIWYLGPWFGFGEIMPWESKPSRVVLLLALLGVLLLCWYRLPLFLHLALIAIALVWTLGPHLLIAGNNPLKMASHRWVVIGVILLLTLLWGGWRLLQALAINPGLLDSLVRKKAQNVTQKADTSSIYRMIAAGMKYTQRVERALPLWQRFLFLRDMKARLPWFMVLGAEGAGKTSMLFSSGMDFPQPEQLNRQNRENLATENVECLYTNDGVFLDTSGRYLSDEPQAQEEWQGVLGALKKYRPELALNGVIVTLSVEQLLDTTAGERLALAATLRARLNDVREQLGLHLPIYVTVTRMDMLPGFSAYFRDLTAAEREQVWGITLPFQRHVRQSAGALRAHITSELSQLEERLGQAMCLRHQDAWDVADRKAMYTLPQDFRQIAQFATEVLQNIFFASRYDETQFSTTLRGIYFLSSCQPGQTELLNNHTLVQRWSNLVQGKRPETAATLSNTHSDENVIGETAWGRHYFLRQLFSDVISADRYLVSISLRTRSKYRLRNLAGHVAALVVGVWLMWGLINSFTLNKGYLDTAETRSVQLSEQVDDYVNHPEQQLLPGVLYSTQVLAQYLGLDLDDPDLKWRYGLYTAGKVERSADKLYTYFLQNALLPKLQQQAALSLQQALSNNDNAALWSALKLYLMLAGKGEADASYMIEQISQQWQASKQIDAFGEQSIFDSHLSALFASANWQQKALPVNDALVKQARDVLAQTPETARVWQRLKKKLLAEAPASITLQGMIDPQSPMIFTQDSPADAGAIPGIYTRDGWRNLVKKQLDLSLLGLQHEDSWVTGAPQRVVNPLALREGVLTLYLQEYAQQWQRFLAGIRLMPMGGTLNDQSSLSVNVALLRTLVSTHSPLRTLLQRAVMETTLAENADKSLQQAVESQIRTGQLVHQVSRLKEKVDFNEQRLVAQYVDAPFSGLRGFVQGGQGAEGGALGGTPLSRIMGLLNDQYTRYVVYSSALNAGDIPSMGADGLKLAAEAQTWPDPVKGILLPLLGSSNNTLQQRVVSLSSDAIDKGMGEICRNTLQGRYPFARGSREVPLAEMERFFAVDGVADRWFKENLADKVDTSTHPWRYKGSEEGQGLAFFEQVAAVRDALFDADGRKVALNFTTRVNYLSPEISQLTLTIAGETLRYSHGPVLPVSFHWPSAALAPAISMVAQQLPAAPLPDMSFQGPWAVLRWLDSAERHTPSGADSQIYHWALQGKPVALEISGLGNGTQDLQKVLRSFRCPG